MQLARPFVVLTLVAAAPAFAGDLFAPASLYLSAKSLESVAVVDLEPLDLAALAAEDAEREAADLAPRYAMPRAVDFTPATSGTWEALGGDLELWRLRIRAPGATSLNLGFSRYRMPEGGQLVVYAADLTTVVRPFTPADNESHGELWTPPVPTDELVVEVTLPAERAGELVLVLGQVGQGYRSFGPSPVSFELPESGSCNMDVECLGAADPWRQTMRATGVISTGGSTFCTGSLVNNTAQDRKMFFITANHCGITAGNAASLVVFWNFQNSTCRLPGSASSGGAGDGTLTQFHTGSFFRASNSPSDFTLVELDDPPVAAFNHHWAGWDRTGGDISCPQGLCYACSSASLCAAIHHPNTDEKRVTFSEQTIVPSSYNGGTAPPPSPGDSSHLWVHWDPTPVFPPDPGQTIPPQVTEPGSSGSPLYNQARRFVGQLHGGPSACGQTGDDLSDMYGRFSVSWSVAGPFLDPGATGATVLDGRDNCTPPGVPSGLSATPNGDNRVDLAWNPVAGAERYRVYRGTGACPGTGVVQIDEVTTTTYSDLTVSGGVTYSYRVSAFDDGESCESAPGSCDDATAAGVCLLTPAFTGLASASSTGAAGCGIDLFWNPGTSACGGGVVYNVYRSETPGFVPGPANLLASCIGGTAHQDTSAASTTTYSYVVRAEDQTGFGSGLCASGNEEANTVERQAAATGPDVDLFSDDVEGGVGGWSVGGSGAGSDFAISTAASHSPTHAWFTNDPSAVSDRWLAASAPWALPASPPSRLEFWHRYNTESSWDGGVLETSTDGTTWNDILAGNGSRFLAGGYTGTLNSSANPLSGRAVWQGDIASFQRVLVDLADFAGQSRYFRWRFGADASLGDTGWYLDDLRIFHGSSCTPNLVFADDFESGALVLWSTVQP